MLYTLDPDTMVGVNYEFNDQEKAYILEAYHDLPSFGQGDGFNLEAVVAAAPDVLINYGSVNDATISSADDIQAQTGIPCVVLNSDMEETAAAYRMLGEIFGMPERAEELAVYAEEALAFAESIDIPEEERVSVYFGNGLENLETAPVGSWHASLLELVDAINVAVVEGEVTNRIDVSAEQVIGWNPEVVLLNGEPTEDLSPVQAVEAFLADARYQNVQAVVNDQVYAIPKYPYSWFDRPPGPNRLIGIYWLAELLYPENFDLDIKAEAREFYALYYHMELSDEQLVDLLGY
ncbi:MAG: ABC transporter substrate-binding protein [Bacillota bacterium]|nr:ABC transporter substrate-binding protein [Bacillota bacterium]